VQAQIRSAMGATIEGGTYKVLSDLGVSLQVDGKLSLNSDKLNTVLSGDTSKLSQFLAGTDNISKSDGLAGGLSSSLRNMLSTDGIISTSIAGLKSRNATLDEDYTRLETTINSTVERYRTQFSKLDSLVSDMNSTASYLTQQFNALTSSG